MDPQEFVMMDLNSRFSMIFMFFNPKDQELQDLALRVFPAVTWLAVYRWLHIPVRIVLAQRRIGKYIWAGDL